jgi:Uma2 family endonuclease
MFRAGSPKNRFPSLLPSVTPMDVDRHRASHTALIIKTMAAGTSVLTPEQFNAQYAHEHGYEYCFGEVVQKRIATWLHGLLQGMLIEFFYKLGYTSGSEIDLRIDPNWQPRPNVAAALEIEQPYPTKPVDIVAEVLSDDPMIKVFEKCRNYAQIGIPQIFVFDPESKTAWEGNRETHNLERIQTLRLRNGSTLDVGEIWAEMETRMRTRRHS